MRVVLHCCRIVPVLAAQCFDAHTPRGTHAPNIPTFLGKLLVEQLRTRLMCLCYHLVRVLHRCVRKVGFPEGLPECIRHDRRISA